MIRIQNGFILKVLFKYIFILTFIPVMEQFWMVVQNVIGIFKSRNIIFHIYNRTIIFP